MCCKVSHKWCACHSKRSCYCGFDNKQNGVTKCRDKKTDLAANTPKTQFTVEATWALAALAVANACLTKSHPLPHHASFQAHAVTHSVSETHALKQGKGTRWTPVRGRVYSSTHNRLRDKFQAQVQAQESLPPSWSVGHSVTVTHSLQGYLPKPCCTWQQCLLSTKA